MRRLLNSLTNTRATSPIGLNTIAPQEETLMYDVYGVGNALVDSEYLVTEAILAESAFPKSGMSLVDEASRASLLDLIEHRHGIQRKALASGGSAANTIATVSGLVEGRQCI